MKSGHPKAGTVIGKAYDFCYEDECKIPAFIVLTDGADVSDDLDSIASADEPAPGSFAERFFANIFTRIAGWLADTANGIASIFTGKLTTNELCVSDQGGTTCITKAQLDALLAGVGASSRESSATEPAPDTTSTSDESTSTPADTEAPVITLIGNNPAEIDIDATYSDPGATVSDNVDANLGVYAVVDGTDVGALSNVFLDTSSPGEHTIVYYSVDQAGNRGEATRTVVVGGETTPAADTASSEPTPAETTSTEPAPETASTTPQT